MERFAFSADRFATLSSSIILLSEISLSHEIRTPLNAIIGMSEILTETKLDAKQSHALDIVNSESNALLSLVCDILDVSKIEAGKLELENTDFDIRAMMAEFTQGIRTHAKRKGLLFDYEIAPEVPFLLKGDPSRLRQVLTNLLSNAMKFTESGRIFIRVQLSEKAENRVKIKFMVRDTGIGISKEKQAIIFNSFTQADGSTTRKFGGTGLGTTISKQLVQLMGGEIGVESEPGKGSTFWFTVTFLDLAQRKLLSEDVLSQKESLNMTEVLARTPETEKSTLKKGAILLVEDYPTNQQVAKHHLTRAGYTVELAEDGAKAVDAFKNDFYDLVLMDIQMPVMDGYSATIAIRELEQQRQGSNNPKPTKSVPIIAMTANASTQDKARCLEVGMDDYLSKPLTRKKLLDTMAHWIKSI